MFEVQWDGTDNLGNRVPDGNYTVRSSVYYKDSGDPRYTYESSTHTIAVGTDHYPIAEIEIDGEDFSVDVPIQFYGRASHDPDDGTDPGVGIHSYSWDFGGEPQNDADPTDSTDINPTVTYWQPGEKTVILTVWDNDPVAGASGSGSGTSNSRRGKQRQARHTFNVAGSITVKILSSTEHTPGSETSLAIDTEGVPGRGPDPVTGEDPTTATIYYQVTGGGSSVEIFRTRVSLEIDDDQDSDSNPAYTVVLGENLYGTGLATTWDGKGTGNQLYGVWNAQIKVDIDFDKNTPEPEDYEWEQTYRSGFLPITVYSFPVADAGGNKVVAIDTTTNLVTVSFDGSGSSDPDDGTPQSVDDVITEWEWTFTGTELTQDAGSDTATTKIVNTPYRSVGINEATLIVTDNDRPTPHEDDDTITVTVMDLEYNAPAEDKQLVLPDIAVDASPLPAELKAPITWTMTIGSSNHSHDTTTAPTNITINPFPTENGHFGPNTITATLTYEGVSISKDKSVRLFWSKHGTENGSAKPNWYHFWSQTPASSGNHRWDPLETTADCENAAGYYTLGYDYFYLCKPAGYDIDEFAKTCLHEASHLFYYFLWWENGEEGAPNGYDSNLDEDGDHIPDSEEWRWGFDETKPDSDDNGINDNEEIAEVAELEWSEPDNANHPAAYSQDWSEGGKQWDP